MHPKTIRVVAPVTDENPLGYIVINEDDKTEDQTLFVDKPEKPSKAESSKAVA